MTMPRLMAAASLMPILFATIVMASGHVAAEVMPAPLTLPGIDAPVDTPSQAPESATGTAALVAALRLDDVVDVMRAEGLAYGSDLAAELFPEDDTASWDAAVARIYDRDRMGRVFLERLGEEIGSTDQSATVAFFESDLGRRILELELSARTALLEQDVEDASIRRLEEMMADGAPRLDLVRDFALANDLIEMNVAGALNTNFAFYQGMNSAGAFPVQMTEAEIVADVWSREDAVRAETSQWVMSYLVTAYDPLSDTELADYTAFSRTPEGRHLNAALFAAFDAMFVALSRDMGAAASTRIVGEDI